MIPTREVVLDQVRNGEYAFINEICKEFGDDKDISEFMEKLVRLYEAHNKALDLLAWAIDGQVSKTPRVDELFRDVSLASHILFRFVHADQMGSKYIKDLVHPLVENIMNNPRCSQIEDQGLASTSNLELLFTFLRSFMVSLRDSVPQCPLYIREGFAVFRRKAQEKFLTESQNITQSIFFLRFVCPLITSPHFYGQINEKPKNQKGLLLTARILQSVANDTRFDSSRSTKFMKINHFINECIPLMTDFVDSLLDEKNIVEKRVQMECGARDMSIADIAQDQTEALDSMMRFLSLWAQASVTNFQLHVENDETREYKSMCKRARELTSGEIVWRVNKGSKSDDLYCGRDSLTDIEYNKVSGLVHTPARALWELYTFGEVTLFFDYVFTNTTHRILHRFTDLMRDVHIIHTLPFPMTNRDVVTRCACEWDEGTQIGYLSLTSVKRTDMPKIKNFVRAQYNYIIIKIEPAPDNSCTFTLVSSVNFKGTVPEWTKGWKMLAMHGAVPQMNKWISKQKLAEKLATRKSKIAMPTIVFPKSMSTEINGSPFIYSPQTKILSAPSTPNKNSPLDTDRASPHSPRASTSPNPASRIILSESLLTSKLSSMDE